ncbi:MAG: deoxyribose-phosphate aldolase [Candidatus Humimicrobiaceae bacterium]
MEQSTKKKLAKMIEGGNLCPDVTKKKLEEQAEVVKKNGYGGVTANPYRVGYAKKLFEGTDAMVVGVVGFPFGATFTEVKALEAKMCIENGADELDMVINVGALKEGDYDYVKRDMAAVVKEAKSHVVKAIIEVSVLTDEEIVKVCQLAIESGISYIKTSSGWMGEPTVHHVELIKETVGDKMGVKAASMYSTNNLEDVLRFVAVGADRIGTELSTHGKKIMEGYDLLTKWLTDKKENE